MNRAQQEQARAKLRAGLSPLPKLYQHIFILKFAPEMKDDELADIVAGLPFDKLNRAVAYVEQERRSK